HGVADPGARAFAADARHDVLELLPVLTALDGIEIGADQFDPVLLQYAALVQRDRSVQRGLPAEGGQQGVGTLLLDNLFDELRGDRLDIGRIREFRVGHDGRRIGVHQRNPQTLRTQDPAGLGARVVELARLADDDRARSDDQNMFEIGTARHQAPFIRPANRSNKYAASWGPAAASGW